MTDLLLIPLLAIPLGVIALGMLTTMFEVLKTGFLKAIGAVLFLAESCLVGIIGYRLYQDGDITADFVDIIKIDWLSMALIGVGTAIFLIAYFFSLYYVSDDHFPLYSTFFAAMYLGLLLVLMTNHLFSLFLFWELMVISGYILVSFERSGEALEAGFKYTVISSVGSVSILFGMALLSGLVPSLSFSDIAANPPAPSLMTTLAFVFLLLGFGVTGGIVAFNQWLPDAHPAAPAPVSAILSGVIVKAGIYGIYRVVNLIYPMHSIADLEIKLLLVLALLTITEGNIMVLAQLQRDSIDLKRIFAYSTTTHLGYLLLTTAMSSELGKVALVYHVANHALAKTLLFLISGYLLKTYGTRDLLKLRDKNLGQNRFMQLAIMIPLFSLGGMPLTGGFVSKLLILFSLFEEGGGNYTFLVMVLVVAVINSAIAFGGYLWIIRILLFVPDTEESRPQQTPKLLRVIFAGLCLGIILLGILPGLFIDPLITTF